jgi:hypothetical protein
MATTKGTRPRLWQLALDDDRDVLGTNPVEVKMKAAAGWFILERSG